MVLEFSFGGDQVALAIEMLIMYSEADLWRFEVKNQFEKYSLKSREVVSLALKVSFGKQAQP